MFFTFIFYFSYLEGASPPEKSLSRILRRLLLNFVRIGGSSSLEIHSVEWDLPPVLNPFVVYRIVGGMVSHSSSIMGGYLLTPNRVLRGTPHSTSFAAHFNAA